MPRALAAVLLAVVLGGPLFFVAVVVGLLAPPLLPVLGLGVVLMLRRLGRSPC